MGHVSFRVHLKASPHQVSHPPLPWFHLLSPPGLRSPVTRQRSLLRALSFFPPGTNSPTLCSTPPSFRPDPLIGLHYRHRFQSDLQASPPLCPMASLTPLHSVPSASLAAALNQVRPPTRPPFSRPSLDMNLYALPSSSFAASVFSYVSGSWFRSLGYYLHLCFSFEPPNLPAHLTPPSLMGRFSPTRGIRPVAGIRWCGLPACP